eukprot:scaffold73810_cov29-Tisochrysis_lutea.AAC.2
MQNIAVDIYQVRGWTGLGWAAHLATRAASSSADPGESGAPPPLLSAGCRHARPCIAASCASRSGHLIMRAPASLPRLATAS